jgi:hypothetical protein
MFSLLLVVEVRRVVHPLEVVVPVELEQLLVYLLNLVKH